MNFKALRPLTQGRPQGRLKKPPQKAVPKRSSPKGRPPKAVHQRPPIEGHPQKPPPKGPPSQKAAPVGFLQIAAPLLPLPSATPNCHPQRLPTMAAHNGCPQRPPLKVAPKDCPTKSAPQRLSKKAAIKILSPKGRLQKGAPPKGRQG